MAVTVAIARRGCARWRRSEHALRGPVAVAFISATDSDPNILVFERDVTVAPIDVTVALRFSAMRRRTQSYK